MEMREEDIVIVGAGIAGLTTALGLHRLGLKCLVLESSDTLRVTGFALTLWTNAWRSLDALGVGDSLRKNYSKIGGFRDASSVSGLSTKLLPEVNGKNQDYECRCVRRVELLETLVKELPPNIINYSSKVASIEDSKYYKILHLADGSTIRTKVLEDKRITTVFYVLMETHQKPTPASSLLDSVNFHNLKETCSPGDVKIPKKLDPATAWVLIGCDGVNSIVSKRLGLQKPVHSGRSAIRGFVEFPDGHDFETRFHVHFGGVRYGFIPCYGNFLYWFCTYNSSVQQDEEMEGDPLKMKQFILNKLSKLPKQAIEVVEKTELSSISCSPLKFRVPWNVVLGNIAKDNVTVAGDALHPMTPDIGQGGCSALEDSVVLARCLGEVFLKKEREEETTIEEEAERIKKGLEKYAKERRWRSFRLISTAYLVGLAQQGDGKVMRFLKEKFLADFTINCFWKMADYHCGNLIA